MQLDASAEVRYGCPSHRWISPLDVSENRGYDSNLLFYWRLSAVEKLIERIHCNMICISVSCKVFINLPSDVNSCLSRAVERTGLSYHVRSALSLV